MQVIVKLTLWICIIKFKDDGDDEDEVDAEEEEEEAQEKNSESPRFVKIVNCDICFLKQCEM